MIGAPLYVLALAGTPASALPFQEVPSDTDGEIVVTGERVPRSLSETPSSVVVATEETIAATNADRLDQLLTLIPNVQFGSGEEGVAIRGQDSTGVLRNVAGFIGGTRPRVTMQIDGRPISYYEYTSGSNPAWDVEQVEVFRSPQTTTQGRNSIAGAIFVETMDPTYDWQGRVRGVVGEIGTRQGSAVVSGPLVDGQLAFRLAADIRLGRMASDLFDGIAGANIERDDFGLARLKLLAEPRALPGLRIETSFVHSRSQAPQMEAVKPPFRARRDPTAERSNGIMRVHVTSATARMDYEVSEDLGWQAIASFGDTYLRRFGLPGTGQAISHGKDYLVESLVNWQPEGALALTGGIHHLANRQRQTLDISALRLGMGNFRDRQSSLGLFGEARLDFAPGWEATGGLRYQRDSQVRTGALARPNAPIPFDYDETFDAWLPKGTLSFEFSKGSRIGLMVQRAYNPGGVTLSFLRGQLLPFEAERLWNYELFARARLSQALQLSANIFYNDISNAQRPQLVSTPVPNGNPLVTTEVANAPKAETYGAEVEVRWQATPRLAFGGGIGLLQTEVTRTALLNDPVLDRDFQRSPKFSATGSFDWRPIDSLHLSAQVRSHSAYFSDDKNDPDLRIGGGAIVDARAAWTREGLTLFGYAKNLLDEFQMTYLFKPQAIPPAPAAPIWGTAADPRELGVGLEVRF